MRVTNSQTTALMHGSMNRNAVELARLMQQMSSGERLQLPSDDPIASMRLLRIQRSEASLAQYQSNIENVANSLSMQETNLQSISDLLLNARDLLLWAANGANAGEDLGAIAGELGVVEASMLSFINVRDEEGRYLLSGTLSDRPAITYDETVGSYLVTGNGARRQVAVANEVLVGENVTALDIFGADAELFNGLSQLVEALQATPPGTAPAALQQQIRTAIDSLDAAHGRLLGTLTELGGRQNALSLLNDSNDNLSLVNQRVQGELSRLDMAGASIAFSQYRTALEATQKSYLKISELSLFNLL